MLALLLHLDFGCLLLSFALIYPSLVQDLVKRNTKNMMISIQFFSASGKASLGGSLYHKTG